MELLEKGHDRCRVAKGAVAVFDRDIREFSSPFNSSPPDERPIKPPKPVVMTIPGLDENLPLTFAVEALRKLPVAQRNLLLGHLMALLQMHASDLAVVALHVQPYLTDDQIATLCGKSTRQLRRYDGYQKIKPDVADAMDRLRRRSYRAAEPED